MSSGSSDSETISECEFETISESDKESIRGCYNNEPEYSQEGVILRIHTKSSMYRAVHVTKSEANKILEVFAFDSANYSFYLLCVMASVLVKRCFLYFNCIFFLHGKCFD